MRFHRHVSRRVFAAAGALGVASLASPVLWAQSRPEKARVNVAVGGKASLYYLPLTIAEQLGYFAAEGLDVRIHDFAGGTTALQAVVAGAAEVCSGAFEHIINLQAKNQMFQAFVMQGRAPQIAFGVSVKNLPNFKKVTDLRGKKIGVTALGSSTNLLANLVLSRGGLKAQDVIFVGVGSTVGALDALRSGQIDAMSNIDPVMTMLEQKGDIKIISDTRTLKGTTEVFGGLMPAACLYAPAGFVQTNPNTCQALAYAIVRGLKWLQTAGPGDIIKTVPEAYLLGDQALYLASFNNVRESISLDGVLAEDAPRTALKALASLDPAIRAAKIDLAKTYTNQFASLAKIRFQA